MKTSSLNEGDVFILDLGKTLFQWNGKQANKYEKFKGLEMITHIKDKERGGKATAIFLGELGPRASACLPSHSRTQSLARSPRRTSSSGRPWAARTASRRPRRAAMTARSSTTPSSSSGRLATCCLLCVDFGPDARLLVGSVCSVSDASGSMQITSIAKGKLEKKMLDSADVRHSLRCHAL